MLLERWVRRLGWDAWLTASAGLLVAISLIALRSASATLNPALLGKQATWIGFGLVACLAAASFSYTRWIDVSVMFYVVVLALLLLVELAGTVRLGAARWISVFGFSLQPSEMMKLATASCLARYLATQPSPLPLRGVLISAVLAGIPAAMVFLQPDLGTSSVVVAIWLGAVWAAGMSGKHLSAMIAAGLVVMPIGWHFLKEYQRARLLVFLNPQSDPLGAGYTIIQSQIAIGSGRWLGRGWMAGTQNQLNFLPERHSDFLYSVIGEEWGFLGACAVIVLFVCVLWRATAIAQASIDPRGKVLAMSLAAWIGYQAVVNIGMVMGLLPVVGVPLPLVSYGGSAMLTVWFSIGLLNSIHRNFVSRNF